MRSGRLSFFRPPLSVLRLSAALASASALATSEPAVVTPTDAGTTFSHDLPFTTVFAGRERFDALLARAAELKELPIGQRTAAVGRLLVGTPYRGFTLELDDRIEAPSVNLNGLDCWTFFESSLAFARMLDEPRENWTPMCR